MQKNGIDFTIAIAPSLTSIKQDLLYIKSALLYADTITLISPAASTYFDLTSESDRKNEKALVSLFDKVLPFCKAANPDLCNKMEPTLAELRSIVYNKKYKSLPMKNRLALFNMLKKFGNEITDATTQLLGSADCAELVKIVNTQKVNLYQFQTEIGQDDYINEFYIFLKRTVEDSSTFPLFDSNSNSLIKSAINDELIELNEANKFNATHAGLTNNLLVSLPSFEYATVDEILDIRKELEKALVRFRRKALSYNDEIQSMPWDHTFQHECMRLYQKEVAPAVLEIDEISKETGFLKNLGYNIVSDNSILKTVGGLSISIASAGAISAFSEVLSFDTAILASGGAYLASKVTTAYQKYKEKQKEILKKDLYFYYKAGRLLEK